jgi:inorganic pyrophosphatase
MESEGKSMRVFIENEAGSRRKNTYDERTLRHLATADVSAAYPYPYGFVIGTLSGDGDAVDCFVITAQPLAAGSTVECDVIGLLEQVEDGEVDHKVLAAVAGTRALVDVAVLAALKYFIANVFAHVRGKNMVVGHLLSPETAQAYLSECRDSLSAVGNTES